MNKLRPVAIAALLPMAALAQGLPPLPPGIDAIWAGRSKVPTLGAVPHVENFCQLLATGIIIAAMLVDRFTRGRA